MGLIIFWSVIALFYFTLTIVTGIALCNLKRDLSKLDHMSPSGIINNRGKAIPVESTLYKALKAILITDILGFLAATAAAIVSIIFTT
jgi:hypothetical protein